MAAAEPLLPLIGEVSHGGGHNGASVRDGPATAANPTTASAPGVFTRPTLARPTDTGPLRFGELDRGTGACVRMSPVQERMRRQSAADRATARDAAEGR